MAATRRVSQFRMMASRTIRSNQSTGLRGYNAAECIAMLAGRRGEELFVDDVSFAGERGRFEFGSGGEREFWISLIELKIIFKGKESLCILKFFVKVLKLTK